MAASSPRDGRGRETPQERTRRLARERKRRQRTRELQETGAPPQGRDSDVAAIIGKGREDIVREVFKEELRPVVREAIDQDAVRAIRGMVGLAPAAILVLGQALESDDEVTRTRAASLIVKYTMGNPMVTPPRDDGGNGLVIINQLPRPAAVPVDGTPEPLALESVGGDIIEAAVEDDCVRRCDTCNLDKPCGAFPGDGPRCQQCLDEKKERVIAAFLKPDERGLLLGHAVQEPGPTADVQRPSGEGGPEVHQAGPRLQSGDIRPSWVVQGREANPSGHEGSSPPPQSAQLRDASAAFPGPPDFRRWSLGRG